MSQLRNKSIYELRGIAQAVGLKVDWAWDKDKLIDKIEIKLHPPKPPVEVVEPLPQTPEQLILAKALEPYISLGMRLTFPQPDYWHMQYDKREDTGSINLPLRTVIECAKQVTL